VGRRCASVREIRLNPRTPVVAAGRQCIEKKKKGGKMFIIDRR
jgi:hypothetical protein